MEKSIIPSRFSNHHPIIPENYTPAWKLDMVNRERIVENAKLGNIPQNGVQTTLYLEKRERLSQSESRESIMKRTDEISRNRILRPWFHSPLSKHQSTLMFRCPEK